jgi:hypothetical protein
MPDTLQLRYRKDSISQHGDIVEYISADTGKAKRRVAKKLQKGIMHQNFIPFGILLRRYLGSESVCLVCRPASRQVLGESALNPAQMQSNDHAVRPCKKATAANQLQQSYKIKAENYG